MVRQATEGKRIVLQHHLRRCIGLGSTCLALDQERLCRLAHHGTQATFPPEPCGALAPIVPWPSLLGSSQVVPAPGLPSVASGHGEQPGVLSTGLLSVGWCLPRTPSFLSPNTGALFCLLDSLGQLLAGWRGLGPFFGWPSWGHCLLGGGHRSAGPWWGHPRLGPQM